jgi:hypothetical protein
LSATPSFSRKAGAGFNFATASIWPCWKKQGSRFTNFNLSLTTRPSIGPFAIFPQEEALHPVVFETGSLKR